MIDDDFKMTVATSLGRIEQKVDGLNTWLGKHVEDDREMASDITKLRESAARQKGIMATLTAIGGLIGAGGGYLIDFLTRGHH